MSKRSNAANGIESIGLQNMEERARLCGGQFSIKSRENAGTKVVVQIPYVPEEKTDAKN